LTAGSPGELGILPINNTWPGLMDRPARVVVKVFVPVPIVTEDFVLPMILPPPAPINLIPFEIVTGVDQVN